MPCSLPVPTLTLTDLYNPWISFPLHSRSHLLNFLHILILDPGTAQEVGRTKRDGTRERRKVPGMGIQGMGIESERGTKRENGTEPGHD